MHVLRVSLSFALATAFLVACGGDDNPTNPGGNDNGGGDVTREIKASPSFASDILEILTRNGCTSAGCHGGGAAGMTLGSSASANFGVLVGVPSTSEPGFNRVTPSDATNSYIVIKLEGRQTVGAQMPLGRTQLDNVDLTNIKNWINNGAMNN